MFGFRSLLRLASLASALLSVSALALVAQAVPAEKDTLRLYLDADFTVTQEAAGSILDGITTALAELGGEIAGHPVEIVPTDHRSSPKRSARTIQLFHADPNGIAVVGGMQSPPYLTYGDYINANGIPLLLPWSAAAPVTRMAMGDQNYVFRLSVDDSKAGGFLLKNAVDQGCDSIAVALTDTGWGRANLGTISAAAEAMGIELAIVELISPNLGPVVAQSRARAISESGADCIVTVVTSTSGSPLFQALYASENPVRVFSHWGIFGGDFFREVTHEMRVALDLRVLQTCALEREREGSLVLTKALNRFLAVNPDPGIEAEGLRKMSAHVGFVHAYDLTLILSAAIEQAAATSDWAKGMAARRSAVKQALETLETPVRGILRTYDRPFSRMSEANYDGHEALGADDLCMATIDADGHVVASPRLLPEG